MVNLLNEIYENNITISLDGTDLKLGFKNDVIDEVLIKKIKENKQEIVSYLTKYSSVNKHNSIPKAEQQNSYEVSSSQLRLLSSVLIDTDEKGFNYAVPNSVYLKQDINVVNFKRAVYSTIERHESLRTVFRINEEGQIRQHILEKEEIDFSIEFFDFRNLDKGKEDVRAFVKEDVNEPFDMENGPLIRVYLFQLAESEFVFYCNIHHVISDSWSLEVLFKDIFAFYTSFELGLPHELPELNIQYKDYAVWQNEQLASGFFKNQEAYFKDTFSGELPIINFTNNKSRPAIKAVNGFALKSYLSKQTTAEFKKLCSDKKGSIFMGLLAVWNVLVYKYTNSRDIIIGTAVGGRDHADLKGQIGCYINSLPLRNQIDPEQTFSAFFDTVKENTLSALDCQFYPFDHLLKLINYNKNMSRSPLFDVMILLQNAIDNSPQFNVDDSQIDTIKQLGATSVLTDLDINFTEEGDYLCCHLVYDTDVFEAEFVTGLMTHFKQLLEKIVLQPNIPVQEIDYLSAEERKELVLDFNDITLAYAKEETLLSLFEKQVKRTPDGVALLTNENKFTYAALDKASDDLARYIHKHYQIKKGKLIGIQLDRNEWNIIAILAILKQGCAYVPIAPEMPNQVKEHIIADTQLELLITTASYRFDLEFYTGAAIEVDLGFDVSDCDSIAIEITPSDLAYVIYTSGSTGLPKGVMIEHGQIVNTILSQIDYFNLDEHKRGLQFAPFSFDASVWETFMILLSGGSLHMANEEQRKDANTLASFIKENKINIATLPPSYIALVDIDDLKTLEILITAGEAPDYEIIKPYFKYGTYYNAYGPTEASVCGTVFKMPESNTEAYRNIPIGKPISNAKIHILDHYNNLVPVGVVGEICIGGTGVARGYLNREELTKSKFIKNPFAEKGNLYRTGDLGKWTKEGNIIYEGRNDEQVKIRGYRIELSAIEQQLLTNEHILEAVVGAEEGYGGAKELVAYIVASETINSGNIRSFLSKILPEYMLPQKYVQLEQMPLTINGKIDKKALPAMHTNVMFDDNHTFVAATTFEEKLLVSIWEEVLKKEGIGIKDNFFTVGGDSIKSIQIVSKLKQHGFALKAGDIIANPKLEDLVPLLQKNDQILDQSEVTGEVVLAPIQEFFFSKVRSKIFNAPEYYNHTVLLQTEDQVDPQVLKACIDQLVQHHDVLRMKFPVENNIRKQYNKSSKEESYTIHFYDLREDDDYLTTIRNTGIALQSSFDLATGPLVRIGHFRLKDGDRIAFIIHHLVVDGVSWRILLQDFADLYANIKEGNQYKLPYKTSSYQTWAKELKAHAQELKTTEELSYWQEICMQRGTPLYTLSENEAYKLNCDTTTAMVLDKEATTLLQTSAHALLNTQIDDIILTCLGLAIKDTLHKDSVTIQMEGHGREEIIDTVDISRTVGYFTSFYPFVLNVSKNDALENLVKVKEDLLKIPNKGIGYSVLHFLNDDVDLSTTFDLEYNYLGDFGYDVSSENDSVFRYGRESMGGNSSAANYNNLGFSVVGMISLGELKMNIGYSSLLFEKETMDELSGAFKNHLVTLVNHLTLLSESQAHQNEDVTMNTAADFQVTPNQEFILGKTMSQGIIGPAVGRKFDSKEDFVKEFKSFLELFPILRTQFYKKGELIKQRMLPSSEVPLVVHYETEINQGQITALLSEPFDVMGGALVKVLLIQNVDNPSDQNSYIFLSIHHALTDTFTNTILLKNLKAYFNNQPLEVNHTLYYEFAVWQKAYLHSPEANEYRKYWLETLKDAVRKDQTGESSNGLRDCVQQTAWITGEAFKDFSKIVSKTGLTFSAFFTALHQLTLNKYTDKALQLILVQARELGTNDIESHKVLGVVNNFLPLPILKPSETTKGSYVKEVYSRYLEALTHQQIPYEVICEDAQRIYEVSVKSEVGGLLNFIISENEKQFDTTVTENKTTYSTNDFTQGIDLICNSYPNAVEVSMSCSLEKYNHLFSKNFDFKTYLFEISQELAPENLEKLK
ncbi:non-ribosomal peptide synthetase [Flavobacterium sp. N502540]|uniref:non-ribosomal peptide synthetase n=1 Tax=Flavobacterium sp. N502540 TaxID=2986838 RepID=UPI002224A56E|nr:non-ribosomal peptide synthetase [Flavobacterium sp. N502540]